jgi:glycerophosphoryl diester phosphodiesterase
MGERLMSIGHRGACGYEPENTLASFRKAIELGIDMIELDAYVCKSGELVVIHDDKVDRTTNGKGYVVEKTLEELRDLDAGKKEKIPTLIEVLDLIDKKTKVNIELKGVETSEPVSKIINKYVDENGWSYEDFLVSSFNHYELQKFSKINSNVKIGALICGIPLGRAEFVEKLNPYFISPSLEFIDKEFVDDAHKRGLKVFVYTVNCLDDIKKMKKMGADGLFSNFPDRIY